MSLPCWRKEKGETIGTVRSVTQNSWVDLVFTEERVLLALDIFGADPAYSPRQQGRARGAIPPPPPPRGPTLPARSQTLSALFAMACG